jgi:hypothetical protein
MLFKDLKTGYQVYILHRGTDIKVGVGKVMAVSPPRFPQTQSNFQAMQMVVDVTIEENGESKTYTTPDSLSVTYAGNELVIATEREGILKEIEAIKARNEEELLKVSIRKATVAECEKILAEWNPQFKEKRETEERFAKIETSMTDLKSMLSDLLKELKG